LRDERQRTWRGGGWRRWSLSKGAWSRSLTTNESQSWSWAWRKTREERWGGDVESKGREGRRCRDREQRKEGREGGRRLNVGLGLRNLLFILVLFLSGGLVEPIRFGSVQSVSDFENRNRTEPDFFCDFLIG